MKIVLNFSLDGCIFILKTTSCKSKNVTSKKVGTEFHIIQEKSKGYLQNFTFRFIQYCMLLRNFMESRNKIY